MAARRRTRSRVTSGYYFVLDPHVRQVIVYMTDAEYFDRTGYQSDWHISGTIAVPIWLSEDSEGIFSSSLSREETAASLLREGFRTSEAFRQLMVGDRPNIRTVNLTPRPMTDGEYFDLHPGEAGDPINLRIQGNQPDPGRTPARPWYERLGEEKD